MRRTALFAGSLCFIASTAVSSPIAGQQPGGQQVARATVDGKKPSPRLKVDKKATKAARKFRGLKLDAEQVATNVELVTERLHWFGSLSSALQAARGKNKPLLWIQALGDIDGFL